MKRDLGRIIDVRNGPLWYPCCPTCLAKVCRDVSGRWCCPRNCGDLTTLHYSYRLSLLVSWPNSAVQNVVLFGKCLDIVFGLPADEFVKYVQQKSVNHSVIVNCLCDKLIGRQFYFEAHGCINAAGTGCPAELVARRLYPERGLPMATVYSNLAAAELAPLASFDESRCGGQSVLGHRHSAAYRTPKNSSRRWQLGSFFAESSSSFGSTPTDSSAFPADEGEVQMQGQHMLHLDVCPPVVNPLRCTDGDSAGSSPLTRKPRSREPIETASYVLSSSTTRPTEVDPSACSAACDWSSWRLDSEATVILQPSVPGAHQCRDLGRIAGMTPVGRRTLCNRVARYRMPAGSLEIGQRAERVPVRRPLQNLTAVNMQHCKAAGSFDGGGSDEACLHSSPSVVGTENVVHRCPPLLDSLSAGCRNEFCCTGSPGAFVHSTPLVTEFIAPRRTQPLLLSPVVSASSPHFATSSPHSDSAFSRRRSSITLFSESEHSRLT